MRAPPELHNLEQPPEAMETEAADEWPEPDALRRPIPRQDPYPVAALGPILGPAARAISETVQAAEAIIGGSLLAAASLAAMPHWNVEVDGRSYPIAIWVLTVAGSGERKSAVDGLAVHAHDAVEQEAARAYKADMAEHERQIAEHTAAEKKGRNATLGVPVCHAPEAPLLPWIMTREPTIEGLHKLLANGRGFAGLMSDDAGDFLGGFAMGREHRVRTVAALSSLWDRGRFDRIRSGDGASKYWGRRLAMHLMIQPVLAEGVLSDPLLSGQGFLPRCLLTWPEERAGTRRYVARDLTKDPAMQAYWDIMRGLLTLPPRVADGSRNELEPVALRMDDTAKALWIRIADGFEQSMAESEPFHAIRAWASKASEQVLRVAGVLTVVETPRPTHIDCASVERAAQIVTFHMREAARLVGNASVPVNIRNAEAVIGWLRQKKKVIVYSGEIIQRGPTAVREAKALRSAMEVLEMHGYARRLPEGTILDGKSRKSAWKVRRGVE